MKKQIYIFFFVLNCNFGYTQSKMVDSLSRELSVAIDDKHKVLLLSDISYSYRLINPDTAFVLSRKALDLARKLQFAQGEANALSSMGSIYRIMGDLQNALSYQFESMHIAEKGNYDNETGKAYLGLSNIYTDLKDFDVAINYGKRAYQIYSKLNNNNQVNNTLANIGEAYNRKNQLDSALYYLQLSYEQALKKNEYILTFCLSRLGVVNLKLKNYAATYEYAQTGLEVAKKSKNIRGQCMLNQILSEYYKANNKLDSAIYYAKIGFDIAKTYNYKWDMLDGSNALANLYESKNLKEAYYYARLAKSLNDTLYGADRVNALQKKLIYEQEQERENQAKVLADQNRMKQTALFIGLCIASIIGFILYRNNWQKKQANILLNEQKEKVEQTLSTLKSTQAQLIQSEKLASLGELTAGIAHEIQNPLNFVNNFSEVSAELVNEMKEEMAVGNQQSANEIADDLKQNLEKITLHGKRASSIVKGMLEHSKASSGEKVPTDINALADEYLRLSYHGLRAKNKDFNSDFKIDFDPNVSKVNIIPQDMGRVLLNLINNAFYAAYESKKPNPMVKVTTKLIPSLEGQGWVSFTVKDNGNGIPKANLEKIFQPFFTTKPTGQGTGLGLSLAYDIVTKGHGGTIEVESVEGEGTEFMVKLPI